MDDDIKTYYPIDFGSWRQMNGPRWDCPKHGPQDGGLAIQVKPRRDRGEVITRRYCAICVLMALDVAACSHEDTPSK